MIASPGCRSPATSYELPTAAVEGMFVRVVMVSKALVVGAYQRKLEELARQPGIELIAVAPPVWRIAAAPCKWSAPTPKVTSYASRRWSSAGNITCTSTRQPALCCAVCVLMSCMSTRNPDNLATWHLLQVGQAIGRRGLFFTWQNLHRRYPWPFRHFEQANYRRAAHAIAGSEAAAAVLRYKGYRGPISVIPQFGVDPAIFSPASPETGTCSDERGHGEQGIGDSGTRSHWLLPAPCCRIGPVPVRHRLCRRPRAGERR